MPNQSVLVPPIIHWDPRKPTRIRYSEDAQPRPSIPQTNARCFLLVSDDRFLYAKNRCILSRLSIDMPVCFCQQEGSGSEVPFGVFFVHGRRFNGFHCRFRDIARGGMRIVTPQTSEQVAIEAGRQFDECYALAYAQQLKNKDIPEGGSKAVLLVDTTNSTVGTGGARARCGVWRGHRGLMPRAAFAAHRRSVAGACLVVRPLWWFARLPRTASGRRCTLGSS